MLSKIINKVVKKIKSAKISIKLTIIYAFMFSVVLILLNALVLYGVKHHVYNQDIGLIQDTQDVILNEIKYQNEHSDLSNDEIFSDVPSNQNICIRIVKEDGNIINTSDDFNYKIKLPKDTTDPLLDQVRYLNDNGKDLLYKNVKIEDKEYGVVYIQIVKDMDNEYDFFEILFAFMVIADFIGIIASLILGYIASKRMLKPIDYITKTAENISINNLKERIEGNSSDDEISRLINTFNSMIDRLQESFNSQVQFVSDASHELRTPIAVIQGYANLLDRWGKDDKEALEKSIYAIKLEANSMADLVERLLFLARGDSGTQIIEKRTFHLNELVNEVVSESKLIAPNHIITSNKNDTVSIIGDYKMIKQMLRIFIDNSIKFTPENSKIDISLKLKDKLVMITISDSGIGIPKEEIKKIFDRFYIVDKSRSKEKCGTGLGLSIAKWIIDMHEGTIEVESEEDKGTQINVSLNL